VSRAEQPVGKGDGAKLKTKAANRVNRSLSACFQPMHSPNFSSMAIAYYLDKIFSIAKLRNYSNAYLKSARWHVACER
jgi:hypothetical protein